MYGCGKDCPIFIPFRLPQISCFSLSLKCFSSDSDNCPAVGIPHLLRAGPLLLTLLFFPLVPSSYRPLCDCIHSFPLVRPSCPLLAGVLRAFLCLKVYSCCIHGERCTPCPPTPLPSRSSMIVLSYENWGTKGTKKRSTVKEFKLGQIFVLIFSSQEEWRMVF